MTFHQNTHSSKYPFFQIPLLPNTPSSKYPFFQIPILSYIVNSKQQINGSRSFLFFLQHYPHLCLQARPSFSAPSIPQPFFKLPQYPSLSSSSLNTPAFLQAPSIPQPFFKLPQYPSLSSSSLPLSVSFKPIRGPTIFQHAPPLLLSQ